MKYWFLFTHFEYLSDEGDVYVYIFVNKTPLEELNIMLDWFQKFDYFFQFLLDVFLLDTFQFW